MARWTPPPAPQHSTTPCCNSSRVVPGARFCPNCGAASPTNVSPPLPPYSSTMRDKGLYEDAPLLPGDATPSRDKGSLMVKLLVFLCGVAAFARTEAVLLQTQYFAMCRGYGPQVTKILCPSSVSFSLVRRPSLYVRTHAIHDQHRTCVTPGAVLTSPCGQCGPDWVGWRG